VGVAKSLTKPVFFCRALHSVYICNLRKDCHIVCCNNPIRLAHMTQSRWFRAPFLLVACFCWAIVQQPVLLIFQGMANAATFRKLSSVAALIIEPCICQSLHQHISLCRMIVLHDSLCLELQLDVSSLRPFCIGPSRTLKKVKKDEVKIALWNIILIIIFITIYF
jgi:hypothetical protein